MKQFKSAIEFQKHFDTDEKCRQYLELRRWGNKPCCVFCGSANVTRLEGGKLFQCNEKECRKQFTVTVGTAMDSTKLPLTKWFLAMYILSNHSKGMSSMQLAGFIGTTQKTAWHLAHRIRQMLADTKPELLDGIVEVDEVYIQSGTEQKAMVFGAVARTGNLHTKVIADQKGDTLKEAVREHVSTDAVLITDENVGYKGLKNEYRHVTVNHSKKEYVRGAAHINKMEGAWNLLRKQIDGIHHFVTPKHLQRYCNEFAFRYNRRLHSQDTRFAVAFLGIEGTLGYKYLTGKV